MLFSSVKSTGTASAEFDVASINLSIEEFGKTASAARDNLGKATNQIDGIVKVFEKEGLVITKGTLRSSVFVEPNTDYNHTTGKQKRDGFKAIAQIQFQTETVAMVNKLYEALISVETEGLTVSTPSFKLKKIAVLQEAALVDAWERVQNRFKSECKVLGLKTTDYEIANYTVGYDDSLEAEQDSGYSNSRSSASTAMNYSCTSINIIGSVSEINSGKANIRANLVVSYQVKGTNAASVSA